MLDVPFYQIPQPVSQPRTVSVAVPTYNQPSLLIETLDTVFAQTFRDFEVVVVDDGSTDDTSKQLFQYVRDRTDVIAGRMKMIWQENQGIGAARNRAIDASCGKYVALLDHDDLWKPGKLAAQVAFMEAHPACVACSVPWSSTTDPGRIVFDMGICDAEGMIDRPLRRLAQGQVFLISSSIMFDRERCQGLRYETRRKCIEDTPFQIGLFGRGAFGIAGRDIQMVYRNHASNYSSQVEFFANGIRMLRELDAAGRFNELVGRDRADLRKFLAQVGRIAVVRQLLAGRRMPAAASYAREMPWQLFDGAMRFVLTFPFITMLPRRALGAFFSEPAK